MQELTELDRKLIAMKGLRDELAKTEALTKRLCGVDTQSPGAEKLGSIFDAFGLGGINL